MEREKINILRKNARDLSSKFFEKGSEDFIELRNLLISLGKDYYKDRFLGINHKGIKEIAKIYHGMSKTNETELFSDGLYFVLSAIPFGSIPNPSDIVKRIKNMKAERFSGKRNCTLEELNREVSEISEAYIGFFHIWRSIKHLVSEKERHEKSFVLVTHSGKDYEYKHCQVDLNQRDTGNTYYSHLG